MKIVVIGGNGLIGKNIVRRLRADGHLVVAASRSTGVDVITGVGLAGALVNTDAVVDVSNSPEFDGPAAFDFFKTAGINIVEAEVAAGVKHHVALSVVGTERLAGSPYLRGKALQDRLIRDSGVPFTVVHATQFFEFLLGIIDAAMRGQTVRLSPAHIQPVASDDVAALMADIAAARATNQTIEIAGPERERMSEIVQRFLTEIEAPYDVITDADAPYFGATLDDDSLVPADGARIGTMAFGPWFAQSELRGADW
ncbi:SDR family oxidoreductase [Pinirhizobacter sp.]|jgi:uncharacterized protein YbjT (DUF2867 family)|uniref:SDR family oxidoreductase n=1 Tax=Pinirhizobacter sp. TaxID=2950432 RepID=UPI002F3ECD63